ncbi:MAG: DUF4854 domain-containing protein [Clostridiales Family XIII bacterium]|nr:DUF4854 domain-containing protein [Clostridiales Family XIII bacterium]
MKKTFSILLVLLMVSVVALSGCGKASGDSKAADSDKAAGSGSIDPKLEEYIDASKDALNSMKEALGDTMELTVSGEGTTLVYTYKFKIDVDKAQASALEKQESTLKQTAESAIIPEMKKSGIKNPQVKYVYLNSDGSELYSLVIE